MIMIACWFFISNLEMFLFIFRKHFIDCQCMYLITHTIFIVI